MINIPTIQEVKDAGKQFSISAAFLDIPHLRILKDADTLTKQWQNEMNEPDQKGKYTFEFSVMFIKDKWVGLLNLWDVAEHDSDQRSVTGDSYYEVVKTVYELYLQAKDEK